MEIYFHSEDLDFELQNTQDIVTWINDTAKAENYVVETINYIFCSDMYLLGVNRQYLNHDYYTDIITFDYNEDNRIVGDLFISIDRVKDYAQNNQINFKDELNRVMIHGVLHLCGYPDKSEEEAKLMRSKEDFYLNLRKF